MRVESVGTATGSHVLMQLLARDGVRADFVPVEGRTEPSHHIRAVLRVDELSDGSERRVHVERAALRLARHEPGAAVRILDHIE